MGKKKKVLIVTSEFPPEPGGIGNHAYNLAKELSKENLKVTVVTDQRLEDFTTETTFDKKLPFEITRIPYKKIRILIYLTRVVKIFKAISKNEIVIASGKFSLWFVGLATFFYRRKFIAVVHGTEVNFKNDFKKKTIDFSLKRFQKIIAVSNYTKSLINYLNSVSIEVIPNGFKINAVESLTIKKLKGTPSLITVGSVSRRKGQKNIIEALPELIKTYPNIHYHIVGKPIEKTSFLDRAIQLNVDSHLTFYGVVSEEKKYNLLKGSDIFTMLSENTSDGDVEGFGIALLEANSLGIPTIGAKGCGIEDAILNFKSGILIDNKNHQKFLDAVIKIMDNYSMYQQESKKWSLNFTWNIIIKKYIKSINP